LRTFETAQRYLKLQNPSKNNTKNIKNDTRHAMDQTDLHKAAYEGDAEKVKELLKKGADPNIKDEKGRTPLHEAAYWGRLDVVRLLLVRGADPTVKDKDGRTPLDLARAEGRREVVSVIEEWLRRRGRPSRRRF